MTAKTERRWATRAQLRGLGTLLDRHRRRGVTLTKVADKLRPPRSISYLSEITRGILPGRRQVSVEELERIRAVIEELAAA